MSVPTVTIPMPTSSSPTPTSQRVVVDIPVTGRQSGSPGTQRAAGAVVGFDAFGGAVVDGGHVDVGGVLDGVGGFDGVRDGRGVDVVGHGGP